MLKKQSVPLSAIRVPVKRVKELDADKVEALANDILENGQATPIRIRDAGKEYILVEGQHRLEALRALGEEDIDAYIVRAQLH